MIDYYLLIHQEQEHALVGAITKLGDISNGENGKCLV